MPLDLMGCLAIILSKFPAQCTCERILKIGHYMDKSLVSFFLLLVYIQYIVVCERLSGAKSTFSNGKKEWPVVEQCIRDTEFC